MHSSMSDESKQVLNAIELKHISSVCIQPLVINKAFRIQQFHLTDNNNWNNIIVKHRGTRII